MTRTGADAINYARSRVGGTMPEAGYCLAFTRECFAVPSYYGSAIDAAQGADYPHPNEPAQPGTPVYFSSASVYDHVAFYVSDAEVITTWNADIRSLSMSQMTRDYGPYRGWAEDINTVRIYAPTGPVPPEPITLEADEMFVMFQATRGIALVGSNYYHGFTAEEWATYNQQLVARGIVPQLTLDDNEAGKAQWDLIRQAHTSPS